MKFDFENLDDDTRELMLSEIRNDIEQENLYISERLTDLGKENYASFLLDAAKDGDEETFQILLDSGIHFNSTFLRQGNPVKMPSNASQLLAQSEFNRYYIRAICLKAIMNNIVNVEIYRARQSSRSRPESEAKIGQFLSAKELLEDLRISIGIEPRILPEVNSGLSVKIA